MNFIFTILFEIDKHEFLEPEGFFHIEINRTSIIQEKNEHKT